jgi:glycine/D-amino acid oxidase-like deaminating enzyme
MGPKIDPVPSDSKLPASADVVVIGGGIIGVSSAMYLAERGMSVVVLEKGELAGEQSSRNWGWCRQAKRDPREFALIRESLRLWRGLNEHVGADTGFRTAGILFAARDEATQHKFENWTREAAAAGIEATMARGAEVARLLPGDLSPPPAALYCESDGRAEPQRAASAIALAARRAGAKIFTGCAARGVETAGGHVVSVVSERGPIRCTSVVVAGGAWSRRILKDLGVRLPQLKVRASVARTTPVDGAPDAAFWDDVFAFRRRADGGYTIANGRTNAYPITPDSFRFLVDFIPVLLMDGKAMSMRLDDRFPTEWREAARVPFDRPSPYEASRTLDPAPDQAYLDAALASIQARYPAFAGARIVESWAGFIDATPDTVPVISPVDGLSGLLVATGFSGHGFGIAPGAGYLVADMVSGRAPLVDPREFRLTRFSDGTRPRPVASI